MGIGHYSTGPIGAGGNAFYSASQSGVLLLILTLTLMKTVPITNVVVSYSF